MSIRRNTAYNLIGSIIPLAVSLATIPIYLGLIGETRYGVLAIAWLLLGYFGFFDLGLSRATAQRIALLRDSTVSERAKTFWTALLLNLGLGGLGGFLIWPIANYFFGNVLKVDEAIHPEILSAVPWLILAVPMATLSGVLIGALQGRERFLELNLASLSGAVLFQLLPLAAVALWGAGLDVILPTALFARLITLILLFLLCRKNIFLDHLPSFSLHQAKELIRFGGWVTVSSTVSPIMTILDRFLIGAMIGAKNVTFYTVPFQLGERSALIPTALCSALFPKLAGVSPREDMRLATAGISVIIVTMTFFIVLGMLMIKPFLSWWINPSFANECYLVGQIILIGFWINSLGHIPHAQLQARGRPDLVAKCHLAEVIPYLIVLYFGLTVMGIIGAATAFLLRILLDVIFLSYLTGILGITLRKILVPSILITLNFIIATEIYELPHRDFFIAISLITTAIWALHEAHGIFKYLVKRPIRY